MPSVIEQLQEIVKASAAQSQALRIVGGNTRAFLGELLTAETVDLNLADHTGVISYRPEELMLRVRAGTTLAEIESLLAAEGQMLAFEPPAYGEHSTIGGTVATGLSGPRRPYGGAVRDAVLGVGLILQDGTYAEFGGQVMKNVAGYDVSRLVCGAFGMLGPVVDATFKVLPKPQKEASICIARTAEEAQLLCQQLLQRVSGLSATYYEAGRLTLRFSGSHQLVDQELAQLDGETVDNVWWAEVGNQTLASFGAAAEVWRLSTRPDEPLSSSPWHVSDWGFGQRWLLDPETDPRATYRGSGHWTRHRSRNPDASQPVFEPLPAVHEQITQRLKAAFDSAGLFNPGRMYPGI